MPNTHKRHLRYSTEASGGSKMIPLMKSMMFFVYPSIFLVTGWQHMCVVHELVGSLICVRGLTENDRSYCLFLHSSPLDMPSIARASRPEAFKRPSPSTSHAIHSRIPHSSSRSRETTSGAKNIVTERCEHPQTKRDKLPLRGLYVKLQQLCEPTGHKKHKTREGQGAPQMKNQS